MRPFRTTCLGLFTTVVIGAVLPLHGQAVEKQSSTSRDLSAGRPGVESTKPKLPPRRVPPRRKGEISFDDIVFDMEKGGKFERKMITKEIEALTGKTVKIRGFILPASVFQQVGIKQFVLVRDNQECCFGPGAALYDCIMVKMVGSSAANFSTRPVAVKGKIRVTEKYKNPDGSYLAIYEMDATVVE